MPGKNRPSRQRNNCKRKVAYFSFDEADAALEEVRAAGKVRDETAAPYLCPVCAHFHWGHRKDAE